MFEQLFDKARQKMTTDKACEDCGLTKDTKVRLSQIKDLGYTEDAKMQIGAISHRKDGDYRKVAEGKFVPVKMAGKVAGAEGKVDVAKEQSNRNEAMKKAENESLHKAIFEDLNDKAKTEGLEYKIRKTSSGYFWDKYKDGKHVGGGAANDKTDALNKASKNFEEYVKNSKPAGKTPGSPTKTFSFSKAGHVYQVPASSPEEAVALLKSRGVKGFKPSDAFDESTPRTKATENKPKNFEIGSNVKVKVDGGRPGRIVRLNGDLATVAMPGKGMYPARRDTYYLSDLDLVENKPTNEKELRKSVENGNSTIPSSETSHLEKVKSANDFFDMMKKGGNTENKEHSIKGDKNLGRGDFMTYNGNSVKIERAESGRFGNEVGTLLQFENPESGKNRFAFQGKDGSIKDVTQDYLDGKI